MEKLSISSFEKLIPFIDYLTLYQFKYVNLEQFFIIWDNPLSVIFCKTYNSKWVKFKQFSEI